MRDLGTLYNGIGSSAHDINDAGKVAGWSFTNGFDTRAFLYSDGQMSDLGTLGGPSSVANGINDADKVVGWADVNGEGQSHAFLYADGAMRDLNDLVPEDSGLYSSRPLPSTTAAP